MARGVLPGETYTGETDTANRYQVMGINKRSCRLFYCANSVSYCAALRYRRKKLGQSVMLLALGFFAFPVIIFEQFAFLEAGELFAGLSFMATMPQRRFNYMAY